MSEIVTPSGSSFLRSDLIPLHSGPWFLRVDVGKGVVAEKALRIPHSSGIQVTLGAPAGSQGVQTTNKNLCSNT